MQKKLLILPLTLGLLSVNQSHANCLNSNAESRLRTYCLTETLRGKTVSISDAKFLDILLKREGYSNGLGYPEPVEQTSVQPFIAPIFEYNRNINAGNPDRPLVIGELKFEGDKSNLRKAGILIGVSAGINGRHLIGGGRYIEFATGASYSYSPKHDIGVDTTFANLCSRNLIQNNWYIDGCGKSTSRNRELSDETQNILELSITKLFSTSSAVYTAAEVGFRRFFDVNNYEQNQLQLGLTTLRSSSFFSSLTISLGEAVTDTLAMRYSASATVGHNFFNKAFSVTANYSYADGGKLFGIERNDKSFSAIIKYSVHPRVSVNIGYKQNKSTIDYFNEIEPIIGVNFNPLSF